MSYLPSQTTKSIKLREKFRKIKRKQIVTMTAGVMAILLVVVCLVLLGSFVRSLFNKDSSISVAAFKRMHAESNLIQPTWSTVLQPAPWFTQLGDSGLVIAGDTSGAEDGFPSSPINYLSGYSRETDGPTWRVDHEGPLTAVELSQNKIITFRQMLSEPPGIQVSGYNIEDGSPAWGFKLELAQLGRIEVVGKVVCLTYQMPDGPRVAGYNAETGAKAWGLRVPLDINNPGGAFTEQVYFEADDGMLAYYVDRFFGLVDTSTGKLVRRYEGQGTVVDAAISYNENQVFLLENTLSEHGYRLLTLPFRDGNAITIHEFNAENVESLISSGLYAILVFNESSEDGARGAGFVAGFTTQPGGPQFVHKLPLGFVDDAMPVTGTVGEFLLAHNPGRTNDGFPRGQGSLLRVTFANQGLDEIASFNQPVSWLVPFKEQCVVLLLGGRVISYINGLNEAVAIEKLRYPNLEPRMNRTRDSLAVVSYQDSYDQGQPNGMMAVTIFE